MVKVKSARCILQATISPTFRYLPSLTREFEKNPPEPGDFKSCGFEFAETCQNDWRDWTVFGIARGKEPYVRGALCEAVPEVRQYWLDYIRTLLDYGCDGVDIRLLSHCSGIKDFTNY
jgi:glycosidase